MTIISVLRELLGEYFAYISQFSIDFIRKKNQNEQGIKVTFSYLRDLKFELKIIAKNAQLLCLNQEALQANYDNLRNLGITPEKIAKNARLLGRNQDTLQANYNNLINLGITPEKIAKNFRLLGLDPIIISNKFKYLVENCKLEEKAVQNLPNLLSENSDAFAKKMRILKLEILKLRRKIIFNPNEHKSFFIASPATIIAKKRYCIDNKINFENKILIFQLPWLDLIKKIIPLIEEVRAKDLGDELTSPYKQRYDEWMTEYKKFGRVFVNRRGRRLIVRI